MIQVNSDKSFTATDIITATDAQGNTIDVVSLYGAVELDRMSAYNFTILNKELYNANKEAIQDIVNDFLAEIKAKITELGGLEF